MQETSLLLIERHARMLRASNLAILRFVATIDNADRLNVLAIANEIDGLGRQHGHRTDFWFFRKTSSELCAAVLQPGESSNVTLRQYLARVDDIRLRRALAAELDVDLSAPVRKRTKADTDLWKGLPSRADVER